MKQKKSIIGWAFVLSILVLLMILGDFLALADISSDYVSTKVLDSINVDISDKLPDWSATKGEWTVLQISLLLKSIFMIVIIVALAKVVKLMKL